MADTAEIEFPLADELYSVAGVTITPLGFLFRTLLRAPDGSVSHLEKALGLKLPRKPRSVSQSRSGRSALWLGPDEWLVSDKRKDPFPDCAAVGAFHAAIDISHRQVAMTVSGPGAALVLNGACPLDLSEQAFPVASGVRTVFGKAEILLIRSADDVFQLECWRSFSEYVFALLRESARGIP